MAIPSATVRSLVAIPGRLVPHTRIQGARNDVVAGGRRYLDALARAGADGAVLAPVVDDDPRELLARFDGLVLLGGGDVDPARYGQVPVPEVGGVDAHQDAVEVAAFHAALSLGLPVLGVCRGVQVMNVALGGSLVQHLEGHRLVQHDLRVADTSRTAAAMGTTTPRGHCSHHQALDRLGEGLTVTAWAEDGTVEGVELAGPAWVVGVQWHPEETADVDPANQALFAAFVAACRAR